MTDFITVITIMIITIIHVIINLIIAIVTIPFIIIMACLEFLNDFFTPTNNSNNNFKSNPRNNFTPPKELISPRNPPAPPMDYDEAQVVSNKENLSTPLNKTQPSVEQYNSDTQYDVGMIYYNKELYDEADIWLNFAAKQGHVKAQLRLGVMHQQGNGVKKDDTIAHMWYGISGLNGSKTGSGLKAVIAIQMTPEQITQAEQLTREWMTENNQNNSTTPHSAPAGDFNKGAIAYQKGDYETALREWHPLAEQGHLQAQANLGVMYFKGTDIPQDCEQAVKWCSLAAGQGDTMSLFSVASMYANGQCVSQDTTRAAIFYKQAAMRGNADAQANLSLMYSQGNGVPQDYVAAYIWISLAVLNGDAMGDTDKMFIKSAMTPEQIERATTLFRHYAKEIDHESPIIPEHAFAPHATIPTGDFNKGETAFENEDYATALSEWRTLAKQKHAEAQNRLANMYQNGLGVPQDYVLAYVWHGLAGSNGITTSSMAQDELRHEMTKEQYATGERMFMSYWRLYSEASHH